MPPFKWTDYIRKFQRLIENKSKKLCHFFLVNSNPIPSKHFALTPSNSDRRWLAPCTSRHPHKGAWVPSPWPPTVPPDAPDQWRQADPVGNKGYEVWQWRAHWSPFILFISPGDGKSGRGARKQADILISFSFFFSRGGAEVGVC